MSNSIQASLEAIAFQLKSTFGKRVAALFDEIIESKVDPAVLDRNLQLINDLTRQETGVWMEPSIVSDGRLITPYRVEVVSPNLDVLSPINQSAVERLWKYDLDKIKIETVLNGTVDLKNGKVTGFFTKIKNQFLISMSMLSGHFSGAELMALYFHEVGHAYVLYWLMGETLITNTILNEIVGRMASQTTLKKRILVGQAALKLAGVDKDISDTDADAADITALVLDGQVTRMQKQTGSRWYDRRLAEALADQFAARYMAGAPLVTALAKLERSKNVAFSASGYDPIWVGVLSNMLNIMTFPFSALPIGASLVVLKSIRAVASSYSLSLFASSVGFFVIGKSYDPLPQRTAALRRELVTILKDPMLGPDLRKRTLADLKIVDEELAKVHNFGDVYGKIARYTLGMFTGHREEMTVHQNVEELANNRLYELSALFKG